MWHLSSIKHLCVQLALALPGLAMAQQAKPAHVILITIDGMRGEMITNPTIASENLSR